MADPPEVELGPPLKKGDDLSRVVTKRPRNFEQAVEWEKQRMRERGFIQYLDQHNRTVRVFGGKRNG